MKDSPLMGKSNYENALIVKYLAFGTAEVAANLNKWFYPILGYAPYNKEGEKLAKEALKRALEALNSELLTKTFLVGERISMADIALACHLVEAYKKLFDEAYRASFPNVTRWFTTVVNQPKVKAILGEVALCEQAEVYDAKKFAAKKVEKPKKEAPKKEEDLEEIAAAELKEESKKKNPLDELPPSNFVLDNWKRFYSNNDPPAAIEYFWQNFDAEGFSLWKVEYKYNDELGAIFMSSNLIGGFFQRLDRARKYAFGSMLVTGVANDNKITGYFVFRGQDVPFEVTDAADYESYSFTKADHTDATVKAQFNDYLAWEGSNLPGAFADGKIFK